MKKLILAQKLTSKVEDRLGLEFRFKYFRILQLLNNIGWYEKFTGVVQLPYTSDDRFREFLYHELGHVLLSTYKIPKIMLRAFTRRDPRFFRYYYDVHLSKTTYRKGRFISGYATISTSEDFCETFSAWVNNNYRMSGTFRYDNELIDISNDLIIKKKLIAVKKIIKFCKKK